MIVRPQSLRSSALQICHQAVAVGRVARPRPAHVARPAACALCGDPLCRVPAHVTGWSAHTAHGSFSSAAPAEGSPWPRATCRSP